MFKLDSDVERAAAGDMVAFEELYRRHQARVYSLCYRMTHNTAEAEDLTQTVFVQLFRSLKTFRGDATFTTWLHRLTVNEVLMYFRKRSVRREQTTEDGTLPNQITSGSQDPNRMSIVDRISLDEAIRQLSPGYRAVFILHDVQGYEHGEIGKMLGVAAGTSKSQLHKARMKLRELLGRRKSSRRPTRRSKEGGKVPAVVNAGAGTPSFASFLTCS